MRRKLLFIALAVLAVSVAAAQVPEQEWLRASALLDREAVPRGSAFRLAVVVDIDEGYHINANPATNPLVPTRLVPEDHPAITWGPVRYPSGRLFTPAWAEGGNIAVYEKRAVVIIQGKVSGDAPLGRTTVRLVLSYQGCNANACYQPAERAVEKAITVVEKDARPAVANADVFGEPEREPATRAPEIRFEGETDVAAVFERSPLIYLGVLFVGGLLLNLTPCVFPLIPVTMNVFAQQGESRLLKVLPLAVLYALGIAATFTVVGVLAALAGRSLGVVLQSPWGVLGVVAMLAVLMASTFGAFEIRLPSGVMGKLGGRRGLFGAAFMGMVMGAVAAPCVGPFLLALITFIAAARSVPLGAVSFFVTGLGLGVPYIFLGTFTGLVNRFPRSGGWLVWTKRLLGMTLAGLILYFVRVYVEDEFFWPLVLGLFLFAAVYLGFVEGLSRRPFSRRFWVVRIVAAVAILAAGVGLYVYVTADRPEVEWEPWQAGAIETAKADGKPVLLYFTAEWCIPCTVWRSRIFTDPEVIEATKGLGRVKVDLTHARDGPVKDFARRFDSVNPPGVFILAADGTRVAAYRDPPKATVFVKALRDAAARGEEGGG